MYRDGKGNTCVRAAVSKLRVSETSTVEFLRYTRELENAYRKDELDAEILEKCESYVKKRMKRRVWESSMKDVRLLG